MDAIKAALAHTPWWVFAIFIYVLTIGVGALKTRQIEIAKMAIIPAVFAVWGTWSLLSLFGANAGAIGLFLAAMIAGAGVGWLLSRQGTVRADRARKLIELSGSPVTLVLVLAIFISKYALGYWLAVEPAARTSLSFMVADATVSGVVIGVFIGRFAGLLRRYRTAPPLEAVGS